MSKIEFYCDNECRKIIQKYNAFLQALRLSTRKTSLLGKPHNPQSQIFASSFFWNRW